MDTTCYFFTQHPLQHHYHVCRQYLNHINWDQKAEEISQKGAAWFDVSDILNLFPHLELDENYQLICYLASEYHGIWGRIAAVHRDNSKTPTIDSENLWAKLCHGIDFDLPEEAAPPMEAIYHDGTPEGYFEALLCELFLFALPYTRYERENWDIIETTPPHEFQTKWDSYLEFPDWRPRLITNFYGSTLLVFRRKIENGLGSSSGRDRIYLSQREFKRRLCLYHTFSANHSSMYHGQIDDDTRYTDRRHCCVSSESSILIAEEKEYTAKGFE